MKSKLSIGNIGIWVLYPTLFLGILIIFLMSCISDNTGTDGNAKKNRISEDRKFVMTDIPDELTSPKDRAYFLVTHYWDNFDFSDTAYIHLPKITEQAFVNYAEILSHTHKETAYASVKNMLAEAEKEKTGRMYPYFLNLFKKYFYDPNSPVRDEEYYIPAMDYIIHDAVSSDADKEKAAFNLSLMMKNRRGRPATDIVYTGISGKSGRLYDIKASYTLLLFYNPECHSCEEVITYMKKSPVINRMAGSGVLKILAVYPDRDLSVWRKHSREIPSAWVNGYDKKGVITDRQVYDLKAIPTIYLLDAEKKVILKDADIVNVESYLKDESPAMLKNYTGQLLVPISS